ncbi:molybdate ABC transporter substrate-binding protein [Acinetobacter radioresistens]|jgi:molybdate transport system substrate-binding protein|uniref:Molybdate ABC transporter, periplasmic molybdate-binding protein n=1 Tax=Acinetobacter radioresistens SK82 TaxID=596318 RepID=A0ABP2GNQ7_ACIRA|nr:MULTISPECIES: molybdate ABC transporter substrate-binding protein [Acinetobacter]AWV86311.1 molybdate ABC transporter substrate-binding protein [Acinetobacter radioresistens]EET83400.1 molybdate ABC transporter, periplasmic molybdate-binding protein [Acinetobacter radioresistens SK82]ENV87677.1 molybdate ABC transporter, periplasmic molybdate-binding protein [Acinetobacter radioresistens NIPH 2130]EXB83290.1 molybdate ABC transporter, periplasmic molybdate-binding protein [Acinetobacter sp. 
MKKILFSYMCLTLTFSSTQAGTVKIYAAASLNNAMTEIAKIYQAQYPQTKIVTVFGGSSTLAKQIEAGASSDLFFSADQEWMAYLVRKNKIHADQVRPLLGNQLVMISPKYLHIPFKPQPDFKIAKVFNGYLCTAQMETVPAGKYAKQALTRLRWLNDLKGRIVGTDDVRSTLTFVERGECKLGIVYKTDALISQKVKILGIFPEHLHNPVIYPLALTKAGSNSPEAVRFQKFIVESIQSKTIFHHYGFSLKP